MCFLLFIIMLNFMVSWFGNGTPQWSVLTKTLQTMLHLLSPWWQLDRRIGGTAEKDPELRENKFIENSNEVRKLTLRAAIVIQNEQERGQWFTCSSRHRTPEKTWPCRAVPPARDPSPLPGKLCEVIQNNLGKIKVKINPCGNRTHVFWDDTSETNTVAL